MSQIIVLESCSVCRARALARARTKLSLASTFSSQLKAKRYNASFSVSLLDDSFLLLVLRKIGKMFLYIFQCRETPPDSPRLNFCPFGTTRILQLPIKTTKNNVTWTETDVGCSCGGRSKVSESTDIQQGVEG